jgi:CDP-4-dehydro-6-deoxyglucose reductase
MEARLMQARLIESVEIAPEVRHFVFEAADVEKLSFIPGQFVSFTDLVEDKKITRAYSIASAPAETNRFELCLNLVTDGHLSPRLFSMRPGESVEMQPPLGTFTIRHPDRDAVLIATGTGIAPFRSILHAHLRDDSRAFTLLFGVRHEYSLMYRTEFEEMARRFSHFRFLPTLTRPGPDWTGHAGRVQEHLMEAIGDRVEATGGHVETTQGRRDIDVFLCGLKAMVDDVRQILKSMGFDRKQIFYEKYD